MAGRTAIHRQGKLMTLRWQHLPRDANIVHLLEMLERCTSLRRLDLSRLAAGPPSAIEIHHVDRYRQMLPGVEIVAVQRVTSDELAAYVPPNWPSFECHRA